MSGLSLGVGSRLVTRTLLTPRCLASSARLSDYHGQHAIVVAKSEVTGQCGWILAANSIRPDPNRDHSLTDDHRDQSLLQATESMPDRGTNFQNDGLFLP